MRWGKSSPVGGMLVLLFSVVLHAGTAAAAALSGFATWNYNQAVFRSEDNTGQETRTTSNAFLQRYRVNFNTTLYPYLSLRLGYLFEQDLLKAVTDDMSSKTTFTRTSPSGELLLANPMFRAAVGYNSFERKRSLRDGPSTGDVRDTYTASFGLKRVEDRPTLDIRYNRTYNYDTERVSQDTINDSVSVTSQYRPAPSLDLRYSGSYRDTQNRINEIETSGLTHTGRVSYAGQFFDRRVSLSTDYQVSFQTAETSTTGIGDVTFPVTPTQGISGAGQYGTDVPPETPEYDTMVPKPLLIDGEVTTPTDINIGYTPSNQDPRNIGLVFATPEELNMLFVWVDQDLSALLSADPNAFSWDIYTSSDTTSLDTGPKQWTLWHQAAPSDVVFNPLSDNRFEISFPAVETQLIKVVVRPLSSGAPAPPVNINNIMVTELGAALKVPAEQVRDRKERFLSQVIDLNMRVRLTETPRLYYDLNWFYTRRDPEGTPRYILSNALSAAQRLSRIFSGSARVAREDGQEPKGGHSVAYTYSVSVTAKPLKTLSHSLVVNGRRQEVEGESSSSDAIFLSNFAELYRGINVYLSGGVSAGNFAQGDTKNSRLNVGAKVAPHKAVTINLNHSDNVSEQSGDTVEIIKRAKINGASIAYSPFQALYLFGSLSITSSTESARSTTQNYTASWSPFLGGSLLVSIGYNQILRTPADQTFTTLSPSLRWNINPRMYLDVAYAILESDSPQETTSLNSFNANFKWYF